MAQIKPKDNENRAQLNLIEGRDNVRYQYLTEKQQEEEELLWIFDFRLQTLQHVIQQKEPSQEIMLKLREIRDTVVDICLVRAEINSNKPNQ